MALDAVLAAIDAVAWRGIPDHSGFYAPESAQEGLRALALATALPIAAAAAARLEGGGVLHDHSGVLLPAAAPAAPILLSIAEHGHPKAQGTAIVVLSDCLGLSPYAKDDRWDGLPLCCAVAAPVQAAAHVVLTQGEDGRKLPRSAAAHWRLQVAEWAPDGADVLVVGSLAGRLPSDRLTVEVPASGRAAAQVGEGVREAAGEGSALLRLRGLTAGHVRTGAVLCGACCAEKGV
ncbi:hypothetical protein EDD29_8443 [Actinocorallia herbida]|uniref:Uncharacterized protein n=1 Tax=Actinocorallia herbida TaxID=58109 RepID=A0A3N1DB00_9ACTN|nr:hypothetical protein [Actinocorallia herbida]ROO90705.1 hypothetical protein EDD29_8443 [Actinocorallia herbida]